MGRGRPSCVPSGGEKGDCLCEAPAAGVRSPVWGWEVPDIQGHLPGRAWGQGLAAMEEMPREAWGASWARPAHSDRLCESPGRAHCSDGDGFVPRPLAGRFTPGAE